LIAGIDYGAQLAGTTAICFGSHERDLEIIKSAKKQSADAMILDFFANNEFSFLGIDAPLSVPPGIKGIGDQFLFRLCDRQLSAMSPMFLGGLTARAMKLKYELSVNSISEIIEVYPKALVKEVCNSEIQSIYKSKDHIENCMQKISAQFNINLKSTVNSWHEVDAVLAWISAYRYSQGKHLSFGDESGLIIV